MSEVFEPDNLDFVPRLSGIYVIDDIAPTTKPDEIQFILVAYGIDEADQILVVLRGPGDVPLFVNQPGDHLIGAEIATQFVSLQARGVNEICPPMIVRLGFVFLPLVERRTANQNDPFSRRRLTGKSRRWQPKRKENED